jgi:hypothetical protein
MKINKKSITYFVTSIFLVLFWAFGGIYLYANFFAKMSPVTSSPKNISPQISSGSTSKAEDSSSNGHKKLSQIVEEFQKVSTLEEYKKFFDNNPKNVLYIYAVKNNLKDMWLKYWKFNYQSDTKTYQGKFTEENFLNMVGQTFDNIVSKKDIEYMWGNDLSITFNSNKDIWYVLSLCKKESQQNTYEWFQKECEGSVYFYRANKTNDYCKKITWVDDSSKNLRRFCLQSLE